ncbi:PPE domain-containing protein [Nocardia callitridis]|uniref:PPE domain-containing protein n=1 Tax=Nocardia callitridis TaxID=648753 RepID=A0ABP9KRS4_9NOCA
MMEPPQPGFTRVFWEAREPDRLARDLGTGPGPIPMAEAGAQWARLAVSFGAALVEYDAVVLALRGAWESASSAGVHDRISALRDWLADAAQAAAANAAKAEEHAAANELARLTMPNIADIESILQAQQMLRQIGIALGAPVQAIAAVTDTDSDVAKTTASRVMRIYEAATEPLATPWIQASPPVLTAGTALAAEQSGGPAPRLPIPERMSALPAGFSPPAVSLPPIKTAYVAPSYTDSTKDSVVPQRAPVQAAATAGQLPAGPMPGGVGAAAAGAPGTQSESEHRAGHAVEGADPIDIASGILSAPAVLGGSPATAASAAVPSGEAS